MEHPLVTKMGKNGLPEGKIYGTDVCGDEVFEGDYILEHDGEIILESNVMDYLVDILGAERKMAGK
ncbi:YqaI family protein [Sutcliffiella horikoshii]|uniref:YqaI family protein n=1 Tax=Sutcliffiella horikoshii TaxID=79883 RepID=UPI003CEE481C